MSKNTTEIAAVKRIRDRNPGVKQRSLTRHIVSMDFRVGSLDFDDAARIYADYATVYNRIRRIDGSIPNAAKKRRLQEQSRYKSNGKIDWKRFWALT
jgi:hypothetical protein